MRINYLKTSASYHVIALVLGLSTQLVYAEDKADVKDDAKVVEEVVVTGMRKALEKSLEVKKESTNIVEALDLSDINATPDVTIADAIVRLPGINGARDRGNQSQASIRGLGPRLVFGTLNGREVTSSEPGRSVRYEQYPSELITAVKVYKSQSADLIAGGIAGTIDLETVSPLSYKGPEYSVRAGVVEYEGGKDIPGFDSLGNRYSGAIIKQVSDEFGFAIGAASQLQKNAYPSYQAWGFNRGTDNLPNGAGDVTGDGDFGFVPWGIQAEVKNLETQRDGVMGVLEFKPSDGLHIKYDALYTKFNIDEEQNQTWYQDIGNWGYGENGGYSDVTIDANGNAVAATANQWTGNVRNVLAHYSQTNSVFANGVKVDFTSLENWTIKGDLSYSDAKRDNYWNAIYLDEFGQSFSYDLRGVPSTSVPAGSAGAKPETAALGLSDFNEGGTLDDKSTALALDFNRALDAGQLSSIDFGVRIADRDKEVKWTDYSISSSNGTAWDWGTQIPVSTPAGFFSSYTVDAIHTAPFLNAPSYAAAAKIVFGEGKSDYSNLAKVNADKSWRVTEKTNEAYIKTNFAGEMAAHDYNANIGLRFESLETESFNAKSESVVNKNTYVLPSATLNYFVDEENIIRASISKAISRPPLDELRASQFISVQQGGSSNAGNPLLDPFTSNQADLAYEWYFAPESMLAIALYYKEIQNYVGYSSFDIASTTGGQPTTVWGPNNSQKKGHIDGFEVALQMPLIAGFGIYSNYAFAESDIKEFAPTENPYPMAGLAKDTATLDLWYNNGGFDARLGYKYHSAYTTGFEWDGSSLRSLDAEVNVGLNLSYAFNENFSVRFEANNLTDQELRLSQNNSNSDLRRYDVYGKTYLLDFTWKK